MRSWIDRRVDLRIGLGCLLLTLLVVSAPRPVRADPEVAKFLLEQAKKAITLRNYEEAVQRLERAREEDPQLVEASYLLGQTYEKLKDPVKALGAYRTFRDGCTALESAGGLDRRAQPWLKKALSRIDALGKGEKELDAVSAAFSDQILAFVRRHQQADEGIAIRALERLLVVQPDNPSAERLLADISGEVDLTLPDGALDPSAVPISGISRWDDMLRRRAVPAGESRGYKLGALHIDQRDGSIFWTDPPTRGGDVFVYETDFRVTKELAGGWLVGLAFGRDRDVEKKTGGSELVSAFVRKSSIHIVQATGGENVDIAEAAIESIVLGKWHRLTVAVEGRKVRVFLDGNRVISSSIPGREELAGDLGIFHQRCVADLRLLRLGTRR